MTRSGSVFLEAVSDGRVAYRRSVNPSRNPNTDYYVYRWLVDDSPAPAAQHRALEKLAAEFAIEPGSFAGLFGDVETVPVTVT